MAVSTVSDLFTFIGFPGEPGLELPDAIGYAPHRSRRQPIKCTPIDISVIVSAHSRARCTTALHFKILLAACSIHLPLAVCLLIITPCPSQFPVLPGMIAVSHPSWTRHLPSSIFHLLFAKTSQPARARFSVVTIRTYRLGLFPSLAPFHASILVIGGDTPASSG